MVKRLALISLLVGLLGAGSLSPPPEESLNKTYAKACKHYVNRAMFLPRSDDQIFVVTLADSCQPAVAALSGGLPEERAVAAQYLGRLLELRDTVIDMNMARAFGESYGPRTRLKGAKDWQTEPLPSVSSTGEYLIAHRLGVIRAYRNWLETGPGVAFGRRRAGANVILRP